MDVSRMVTILVAVLAATALAEAQAAVNQERIDAVLAGKEKVARAAWWGFSKEDATAALQAAIDSGAEKVIVEDLGAPWIVDRITLASDQEIVFEKGVVVEAKRGAFKGKGDCLFTARLKENVTLSGYGATFRMHKADYQGPDYDKAEWRHTLSLLSSRNVKVLGLTLVESGGDGIYVGVGQAGVPCTDIVIKDVTCDRNHRQGISVISARNLLIENTVMRETSGTPPIGWLASARVARMIGGCPGCSTPQLTTEQRAKRIGKPSAGLLLMMMPEARLPSKVQSTNSAVPLTAASTPLPVVKARARLLPMDLQFSRRIEACAEVALSVGM